MNDKTPTSGWIDAGGPYEFGLDVDGNLLVSFTINGFPMGISVPTGELDLLQKLLNETETKRSMLGTKPPAGGPH